MGLCIHWNTSLTIIHARSFIKKKMHFHRFCELNGKATIHTLIAVRTMYMPFLCSTDICILIAYFHAIENRIWSVWIVQWHDTWHERKPLKLKNCRERHKILELLQIMQLFERWTLRYSFQMELVVKLVLCLLAGVAQRAITYGMKQT